MPVCIGPPNNDKGSSPLTKLIEVVHVHTCSVSLYNQGAEWKTLNIAVFKVHMHLKPVYKYALPETLGRFLPGSGGV